MLNGSAKLNKKIFLKNVASRPLRDGYGEGILEAGEKNENIVVLCADLTESTRNLAFKEKFKNRFFEIGVAEQNLATVGSGLGVTGKIPFISSYAMFCPGRALEQIRTTICYNDSNVKIMGHHAGISVGPDGATHQAIEDIAIMRTLPNMKVIVPCDAIEAKKATLAAAQIYGPIYIRLAREKTPIITTADTPFIPGKAYTIWNPKIGKKPVCTIIGAGGVLYNALLAAKELEKDNIHVSILNLHTIKPIDKKAIISSVQKSGCVVTVEEHQIMGGIGSAVAEVLSSEYPVKIEMVGINDSFGESGTPAELITKYNLDKNSIKNAVLKVIKR